MEPAFTDCETYQATFDPEKYINTYYNQNTGIYVLDGTLDFELRKLHEAFSTRGVKGKTLYDIGHGPTIYQVLSACEYFDEIIGAEYTDHNREYYERSVRNEPGTFDWDPVIQKVCDMEGKGMSIAEKKKKLESTVKKTLKCDVLKSNPLEPLVLPQVDCAIAFGCLECASSNLETYQKALKNVSSLLKIGAHLMLSEILNCTSYLSGGKRFSCLTITEAFMRSVLIETGFEIVNMEVIYRKYNKEQYELCNHDSTLFVLACKIKDVE